MMRKILIGSAVLIGLTAPVLAQETCAPPAAPTIPDGAKATAAQIAATQNDIKAFAAASDSFQGCIAREIQHQKDLAKQQNAEIDPAVQGALTAKAMTQRQDAQRLASAWSASVQAFNSAQGRKQRQNTQTPAAPSAGGGYGGGYRY